MSEETESARKYKFRCLESGCEFRSTIVDDNINTAELKAKEQHRLYVLDLGGSKEHLAGKKVYSYVWKMK
jgi:hypothetical protein